MKKKILFISATHGNEGFTIPILKGLENENNSKTFDWLIGNPKALKKDIRFIDADLNRVAPGNKYSQQYEIKRAYELQKIFNKYDYVIDLHGTPAKTGIFTIVTNPTVENLCLAASLPIDNVVIWSPRDLNKPGPLTQFVNKGLEIECGPKQSRTIKKELRGILDELVNEEIKFDSKKISEKRFFRVYGKLKKEEFLEGTSKLKEFVKIEIGGKKFFPLLVNRYKNTIC